MGSDLIVLFLESVVNFIASLLVLTIIALLVFHIITLKESRVEDASDSEKR